MLISPDRTRYVGDFSSDQKHGLGLITKRDGAQFEELWNMGELENSQKIINQTNNKLDDQKSIGKKNMRHSKNQTQKHESKRIKMTAQSSCLQEIDSYSKVT